MAITFQTPLTHLQQAVARWPSSPAFKIPITVGEGRSFAGYNIITYTDFDNDIVRYAKYWSAKLSKSDITPGEVVTLCLEGDKYTDFLHIFGLLRAGFVVHCMSFGSFSDSADVLPSIFGKVDTNALIFEQGWFDPTSLQAQESIRHIKFHPSLTIREPPGLHEDGTYGYEDHELPPIPTLDEIQPEQIAMIYHTSGTVSGIPKIVPYSYRRLGALIIKAKLYVVPSNTTEGNGSCQETWTWMDHSADLAQFTRIMSSLHYGCSIIQCKPTSVTELKTMVEFGGLDRAMMFPALLTRFLRQSREDSEVLALLVGLKGINSSGGSVSPRDLRYAKQEGINIKICFASNESAATFVGKEFQSLDVDADDELRYLYSITEVMGDEASRLFAHRFVPYEGGELKELVLLPNSADCPHKSFCNPEDGCYHTGDLFQEIPAETDSEPKRYLFRGRKDDWIMMMDASKCDAGAIENDVRQTCDDLVLECVVVGTHRPSPALIVEAKDDTVAIMETRNAELRREIFRRITSLDSHRKRFEFERIESPERIIVVPARSLIRTAKKGIVRRQKMEEAFEKELDRVYGRTV
ncbi:acetyl-CoA synthetase-like protein [Marasmius fiardii PR-910]|nr:acetyl-CoA synthetase-like protein [Marasmius fiardii PR-910]